MIWTIAPYVTEIVLAYVAGATFHGLSNSGMTDAEREALSPASPEYGWRFVPLSESLGDYLLTDEKGGGFKNSRLGLVYLRHCGLECQGSTLRILCTPYCTSAPLYLEWADNSNRVPCQASESASSSVMCHWQLPISLSFSQYYWPVAHYIGSGKSILTLEVSQLVLVTTIDLANTELYLDICQPSVSKPHIILVLVLNVLTDAYLVLIPITILRGVHLALYKKLCLMVLFSGAFFVIAATIVRSYLLLDVCGFFPSILYNG